MLKTFNLVKSCSEKQKLLEVASTEKVAQNAKSCPKVAEHNLYMPNNSVDWAAVKCACAKIPYKIFLEKLYNFSSKVSTVLKLFQKSTWLGADSALLPQAK